MKRKNLLSDRENYKKIKVTDLNLVRQDLYGCYIALFVSAKFEIPPALNATTEETNHGYNRNFAIHMTMLLTHCYNKIKGLSATQSYARKVPALINNIKNELEIMTTTYAKYVKKDTTLIMPYLNRCADNFCFAKDTVYICGKEFDQERVLSWIENGTTTNNFALLKVMTEKHQSIVGNEGGVKNFAKMFDRFSSQLLTFVMSMSCVFIDVLRLHYLSLVPNHDLSPPSYSVAPAEKIKHCYSLLTHHDNYIVHCAMLIISLSTPYVLYDFVHPSVFFDTLDQNKGSMPITALSILFDIVCTNIRTGTQTLEKILGLLLDNKVPIRRLIVTKLSKYITLYCENNVKCPNVNMIYMFFVKNNMLITETELTKDTCILLKILFRYFNDVNLARDTFREIATGVVSATKKCDDKSAIFLMDILLSVLQKGITFEFDAEFCDVISTALVTYRNVPSICAVFRRMCETEDDILTPRCESMFATIIATLSKEKQLKYRVRNMWMSLISLMENASIQNKYPKFFEHPDIQGQIFDALNLDAIKGCSDVDFNNIVANVARLGIADCAHNNNFCTLITKFSSAIVDDFSEGQIKSMLIAFGKILKFGRTMETNVVYALSTDDDDNPNIYRTIYSSTALINDCIYLNSLNYFFKIIDTSQWINSADQSIVAFILDCYRTRYVQMCISGMHDDRKITNEGIRTCVDLLFSANNSIAWSVKNFLISLFSSASGETNKLNVEYLLSLDIVTKIRRQFSATFAGYTDYIFYCLACISVYSRNVSAIWDVIMEYIECKDPHVTQNCITIANNTMTNQNSDEILPSVLKLIEPSSDVHVISAAIIYVTKALRLDFNLKIICRSPSVIEMLKMLETGNEELVGICCDCLCEVIKAGARRIFYDTESIVYLTNGILRHPVLVSEVIKELMESERAIVSLFTQKYFVRAVHRQRKEHESCQQLWDTAIGSDTLIEGLKEIVHTDLDISEWELYAMLCRDCTSLEEEVVAKMRKLREIDYSIFISYMKIISLGRCNFMEEPETGIPGVFYGRDRCNYENLYTQANNFSDITFDVGGKLIKCHKCILSTESPYFGALFKNNTEPIVAIEEIPFEQFDKIIKFIYLQKIEINSIDELGEMYYFASRFDIHKLILMCTKIFTCVLSKDNVSGIREFAKQEKIVEIKEGIYRWLVNNYASMPEECVPYIRKSWKKIMDFLLVTTRLPDRRSSSASTDLEDSRDDSF